MEVVNPYRPSLKTTLDALAKASNIIKPILCLVSWYSSPILPKPTIKYFIYFLIYASSVEAASSPAAAANPLAARVRRTAQTTASLALSISNPS